MNAEEMKSGVRQPEQTSDALATKKHELNLLLMQQALEQDDPLRGSLGVAVADLLDMSSQVKSSIDACFSANANSMEALKSAGPGFDQYFKCLRQADRFAHLELQTRKPAK